MARKKSLAKKITALIASFMLVTAMVPEFVFAESQLVTEKNVTEADVTEKTEATTTYELSSGKLMTVFHSDDVRFRDDNGMLTDYDPELEAVEDEESTGGRDLFGYAFENREGDSKQYLPQVISEETPVLLEKGDASISMSPADETLEALGIGQSLMTEEAEVETPYQSTEEKLVDARYSGENADLTYRSEDKGVKESLILKERPASNTF
ncbi:MAG: hypothetical protein PUB09_02620 [Firmicutes bacterium]|nr:hypothetical protein [Bacillota bacterium]